MRLHRFFQMSGRILATVLFVFLAVAAPAALIAIRVPPLGRALAAAGLVVPST